MSLLATYVERVRTLDPRIEAAVDQIDRERQPVGQFLLGIERDLSLIWGR